MTLSSVSEYISLTSTAWIRREPPNVTFYGGRANIRWWIVPSLLTWINFFRIQLQKKSSTFETLNGSKLTRKSLKGRIFIFVATFSLPASSLLKFSIKAMVFQELILYVYLFEWKGSWSNSCYLVESSRVWSTVRVPQWRDQNRGLLPQAASWRRRGKNTDS